MSDVPERILLMPEGLSAGLAVRVSSDEIEYRRADLVDAEIDRLTRERDEARAELEAAISHYRVELQAERQRARLPEELFERLQEEVEFFARFPSHHKTLHEALLFDIFDATSKGQQP